MMKAKKFPIALLVPFLSAGCASRSTPEEFPEGSPAALDTPAGQTAAPQELASPETAASPAASNEDAAQDGPPHSHHHHPPQQARDGQAAPGAQEKGTPGAQEKGTPGAHEHDAEGPSTAVYTCPMHPEVTASEPCQCPHCGMNLELKK